MENNWPSLHFGTQQSCSRCHCVQLAVCSNIAIKAMTLTKQVISYKRFILKRTFYRLCNFEPMFIVPRGN